ncbi:hypothetical protein ATK74_1416 [Propionicimonas paludicola]|uniref:Uncharacterized protein n=1 Tax=Propionicimonas paludicola TaxID=185243 RepID=A0A2A9CRP1_9ACTN|nr:hypothetical protein [Propionicimonas paludicola]PFG16861.1 hypothetical protein ATK74_1416 [Propionicimonas paludicola]
MSETPKAQDPDRLMLELGGAEVLNLENEVRTLERHSRNVLGAGFAAATVSLAFASQMSLEVGFVLLTLLWGLAIAWQFNLAAEAAAVAEARDCLASKVNEKLDFQIYQKELVGNVGRGSFGTWIASSLIAFLFIGSQVAAYVNIGHPFTFVDNNNSPVSHLRRDVALWIQIPSTILATFAALWTWLEVFRYRYRARLDLPYRDNEVPDWAKTLFRWRKEGGQRKAGESASLADADPQH